MKSKKRFIKNLMAAEQDLSNKHGDFSLFAACFREDTTLDTWDLVVAASWLLPETINSYTIIMDGVRAQYGQKMKSSTSTPSHCLTRTISASWKSMTSTENLNTGSLTWGAANSSIWIWSASTSSHPNDGTRQSARR